MDSLIGTFVVLLGLCVGSFLNVVVYRLPRGLSVSAPRRSFCPSCRATLAWYDNLPLASWIVLRGRCRSCAAPISAQYPLVEALTALAFALVYHLLISGARPGVAAPAWPTDAPLIAAWLLLAAALLACSAMDIVSYLIDTRITDWTVGVAIILMAVWPRPAALLPDASTPLAAAAAAALVATIAMLWWTVWRVPQDAPDATGAPDAEPRAPQSKPAFGGGALAALLITGLAAALGAAPRAAPELLHATLVWGALVVFFAVMTLAGGRSRDADQELHDAIEQEAPQARGMVLRELLWLLPILAAGAGAWLLASGPGAPAWAALMKTPLGPFVPLAGAANAILGAMVGAAAGWVVRIVFTLAFGQEAFGVGDIYILAAAGAAGGWDIALLGFALAVAIALAGWIVGLLLKRTVMIPFGPPLAIGFLAALWISIPAGAFVRERALPQLDGVRLAWEQQPHLVLLAGGFLLAGAGLAMMLARLLRRLAERLSDSEKRRSNARR